MAATLVAIVQTRLELAAVEVREESLRVLTYLALSLLAMLCVTIAILLAAFLVIVLFWDTHRIGSIAATAGLFAAAGFGILLGVRYSFRHKPRLLSFTIAELSKDVDGMKHLTKIR